MVIISKTTLKRAIKFFPEAEQALNNWYDLTKQSDWKNFSEMRKTVPSLSKTKTMKKEFVINSKKHYHETMASVFEMMNRGEANLTKTELGKIRMMAEAAEKYEDEVLGLRPNYKPDNLPDMVKLVMLEKKLSQGELAEILKVGKPKLSQILNGKRKPDLDFLKLAYKKLKIDPAFILEHI